MLLVYRGKGFMVPLILGGCPFIVRWIFIAINGPIAKRSNGSDAQILPILLGLVIGGAILFAWGRYLNSRPAVRGIERMTGREVVVKPQHSMYGVKVEYWGIFSLACAIAAYWYRGLR
jgi:hypothetical protein